METSSVVVIRPTDSVCHYSAALRPENCCLAAMARRPNLTRVDRLGYVVGGIALLAWSAWRGPRRPLLRAGAASAAGWLLYQAYTGTNPMLQPLGIRVNTHPALSEVAETIVVQEVVTISRPRAEVYAFLSSEANVPRVMEATAELTRADGAREIGWRALRGGRLVHFGSLELSDAPGGRGTIVIARLEYVPNGGSLGAALARIAGRSPQRLLGDALRRARALLEVGEVPSTSGQPSGSR